MYHLYKFKSLAFSFININVTKVPTMIKLLKMYSKRNLASFEIFGKFEIIANLIFQDIETSFTSLYTESILKQALHLFI